MVPRNYTHYDNRVIPPNEKENTVVKASGIPLPNEVEDSEPPKNQARSHLPFNFDLPFNLDFIKDKIHIEELILLGVLFVLLFEGVQDDFLIIMIIYVLLI